VSALCASLIEPVSEPASALAAHAKSAWARLIRKVYEADPLECPKCKGPMRIIRLQGSGGDRPPLAHPCQHQAPFVGRCATERRKRCGAQAPQVKLIFADEVWEDYLYWQKQDKRIVERINKLIRETPGGYEGKA